MTCIDVLEKNAEESYMYGALDLDLDKYVSDEDKAKIIWNLINLGYADTHFTIDEREVVDFLREHILYLKLSAGMVQLFRISTKGCKKCILHPHVREC